MKILTILIFSGNRLSVKDLLSDIVKLSQLNIDIRIVEWSENQKILQEKKKIYFNFKKKIENLKVYYQKEYQKSNFEFKYSIYINKFNTKYIMMIGDDDRINIKNFKKIFKYLDFNFSGITTSFKNYKNKKDLKKKDLDLTDTLRPFDIYKDIHRIGYISSHIFKTDLIKKIFKKEKKYLLTSRFPQNFIILGIIKKFNNWKVSNLKCIHNNVGNIDFFIKKPEDTLIRLKSEYIGYLAPLIKNYPNLHKNKINKIYFKIFFKNIMSWLFLSLKFWGKKKTFANIREVRNIIKEPYIIKIILIFLYICPIFLLNILRILRRMLIK